MYSNLLSLRDKTALPIKGKEHNFNVTLGFKEVISIVSDPLLYKVLSTKVHGGRMHVALIGCSVM